MMRTTSKDISVVASNNLLVSPEVKAILPDVLIDYIWQLAMSENWQTYEKQSFILEAGKLSGRNIQDIYHFCDFVSSIERHRVYGVEPANCKLQILNSQNNYQMSLCKS